MPDRTKAPNIKEITKIDYQIPETYILDNGIKVYILESDNSPVIKMDVVFKAGIEYQTQKLLAVFSNTLLKEAPSGMLPDEVAEIFDYYGSFIDNFVGADTAGLRLFAPVNFANDVFPLFANLFINPSLPENEFDILKNKQFQFIQNNLKKTKYLAMRSINTELFGTGNPRGYIVEPEDVLNVKLNDIRDFVSKHYRSDNCYIMLSGMVNKDILDLCNKYFINSSGSISWNDKTFTPKPVLKISESPDNFKLIEVENSVQSTILIGKNLGKLNDKELIDVGILNTVFGGYFGSRLMKNIREDKGYTYGIGSFLVEYPDMITLKITSDVGSNVTQDAINEIFSEAEILKNKLIPPSELKLVKNFMMGELISAFDGVINSSEVWEKLISSGKSKKYIDLQIERIKDITSAELRELARKFLTKDGFHTVVAGKMN